jgi:hypothetical protein
MSKFDLRFHKHLDVESRAEEALNSPALPLVIPKSKEQYHSVLTLAKTKAKAPSLSVGERRDMLNDCSVNAPVHRLVNEYKTGGFFLHP